MPLLDASHVAMRVNLDACIHSDLSVRACREVQVNDVIGMAGRGLGERIVFDMADPMGGSTCVACGECVQACPTGALIEASVVDADERGDSAAFDAEVRSVCPYCGVGCQIAYKLRDGRIAWVDGFDGPANQNRLCVKGRFGFDYIAHPQRLTVPLVRRDDAPPKGMNVDPATPWTHFREASWDEALDAAAGGLRGLHARHGGKAIAGFGSAKCSNEEAYLFQKLIRQAFGHNNVDHCTRLCHASSVAALMENVGSAAVTATFNEIEHADVAIVIGANPTENHPVAATYFKQFVKRGGQLYVMDPRGMGLRRHATAMLQFRPGTDVALLNAIMNVIVAEGLTDRQYIEGFTEGFDAFAEHLKGFEPERMAPLCGVAPEVIREVARAFAGARAAMIFWGMGISQHIHGTDNSRCLIALALLCGQVGRPGTGLHPLSGTEQRAGRLGRRADPDGDARLPAGRGGGRARPLPRALGRHRDRPAAGADGGRDHQCDPCRPDPRHVHHGREPGDVGPGPRARAPGAGRARAPGGAGPVPDRDGDVRRRDPAGDAPGPRRPGPSPTPTARCRWAARRSSRPGRRARTGRSPSTSAAGSGSTGSTGTRARSSPR